MARWREFDADADARVAVITGGAMGIGGAAALHLAASGHRVIIADRDRQAADLTVAALTAQGHQAYAVTMDVSEPASIASGFAHIEQLAGRCDILVNSAGVATVAAFLDFKLEEFQRTMNINVTGTLLCSQHAARLMVKHQWGRIINIAPVAGMRAVGSGRTAYGTSKGAVIALTRQMAVELAEHGITANAVCPGPVDTPMLRDIEALQSPDNAASLREQRAAMIPDGRYATPEEVANLMLYLASDLSTHITGQGVQINGGFHT